MVRILGLYFEHPNCASSPILFAVVQSQYGKIVHLIQGTFRLVKKFKGPVFQ